MFSSATQASNLPHQADKNPGISNSVADARKDELQIHDSVTPRYPSSRGASDPEWKGVKRSSFNTPRKPAVARRSRPLPAKQGPVTTPHAIRALQQRRKAPQTPGRDRRRSGRLQRETPRDALRNLSRILAPISKKRVSPKAVDPLNLIEGLQDDGSEDELDLTPPKLSLRMGEPDEDDSLNDPPPRLSVLVNDDVTTQRLIEVARKAYSEQPYGRLSKESLGNTRLSDRFEDVNDLQSSDEPVYNGSPSITHDSLAQNAVDLDLNLNDMSTMRNDAPDFRESISSGHHLTLLDDDEGFAFSVPSEPELNSSPFFNNNASDRDVKELEELYHDKEYPVTINNSKKQVQRSKSRLMRTSRLGIPYSSISSGVVKRIATLHASSKGSRKPRMKKATLKAVVQASDWFLEQIGDDLGTYARHAGRKTIDETDVVTLMKRQRQIKAGTTAFSLAQKHLPRELLQDLRMPLPKRLSRGIKWKRKVLSDDDDDDDDYDGDGKRE